MSWAFGAPVSIGGQSGAIGVSLRDGRTDGRAACRRAAAWAAGAAPFKPSRRPGPAQPSRRSLPPSLPKLSKGSCMRQGRSLPRGKPVCDWETEAAKGQLTAIVLQKQEPQREAVVEEGGL